MASYPSASEIAEFYDPGYSYWVTKNERLIRKTFAMPAAQQKREIEAAGEKPIFSYNQTDFVQDRVAIEVQFGTQYPTRADLGCRSSDLQSLTT